MEQMHIYAICFGRDCKSKTTLNEISMHISVSYHLKCTYSSHNLVKVCSAVNGALYLIIMENSSQIQPISCLVFCLHFSMIFPLFFPRFVYF